MSFIAILGCDGSGKSAVIEEVSRRLEANGHSLVRGHWRPKLGGGLSRASNSGDADDPHGQTPRGKPGSAIKLVCLASIWWIAWIFRLQRQSRQGVLLFDRFHADLVVDPRRYRYGGPPWLARLASRLMPQPDRVIYLDAPVEVLLSRKQEVGAAALESARRGYLALVSDWNFEVIDASQPLDLVIHRVETLINATLQSHHD